MTEKTTLNSFQNRHIGPSESEVQAMLQAVGCSSLDQFIDKVVPARIRMSRALELSAFKEPRSEAETLAELRQIASQNKVNRSYIGLGYYDCLTPAVILRNIMENPGWYTQYTPYQPEISQGRLEALLNYQTMICDLTGMAIANASMLDESTAAAEAMMMNHRIVAGEDRGFGIKYFIDKACHPQTIDVVRTRAEALGLEVVVGDAAAANLDKSFFGALLQYPGTDGGLIDYSGFIRNVHGLGALVTVACDLLALTLISSPGELGVDMAVGSSQRFGVPLGFGGPHAAFLATRDDYKRQMPGRLVGVSKDNAGSPALRLALQTREQHIRREKATSNICTAQVLLAVMASMYAVYHGPKGLKAIAERVTDLTSKLVAGLKTLNLKTAHETYFDTIKVLLSEKEKNETLKRAESKGINLRPYSDGVGVSLDECTSEDDVLTLLRIFGGDAKQFKIETLKVVSGIPATLHRKGDYLKHPVFNSYHSETEFLRYLKRLEAKDLSLCQAMIPLGSCTMKLNATTEMVPVTWEAFNKIHPFAPLDQTRGYQRIFSDLEAALAEITGFSAVSLQPNAGSQGEYAGLLAIRAYHHSRKEVNRNICLIPKSAHGTNPASAIMAGMEVVTVECDEQGNIRIDDLKVRAAEHAKNLSCLMVTYPSTHGVFEDGIKEICEIVHLHGGQVYMDGANLNAQVGLCRPGDIGADVCHINLHKTFCIPHGGGGPGMGPIGVRAHLAPFLPGHALVNLGYKGGCGAVSAAPWGSASILLISWAYMAMMAGPGLTDATKIAILNANYVAAKLNAHYPVLYKGDSGYVAHECIFDLRALKAVGIEAEDVAKRLMDYGFHAPTLSFPVVGTLMVEPTESESKAELDSFCEALISIRAEIRAVEGGLLDPKNNPLKQAPHTALAICGESWDRPYSRMQAAFPTERTRISKFWPAVGRIDGGYGDRNLVCSCS